MKIIKNKLFIQSKTFSGIIGLVFSFFIHAHIIAQPPKDDVYKKNIVPDYSDLKCWAAHPFKKDFADSIPKELRGKETIDSLVDVFFIHPTTLTDNHSNQLNGDVNDASLNDKTDKSTILYQATVFNSSCRIFAPRYRQAHIKCFYISKDSAKEYFDIAYEDIRKAFLYYLEHFNHGRPIIIASHSQGTLHAGRILKEFFDGKPLLDKLVCAYIIGLPVPEKYFDQIPICESADQTACFVSWRTFRNGYNPLFVEKESFKSLVVNPLNWSVDGNYVSKKFNKGGVLKNFNKIVPKVVDAKIHGNILWACKPDVFGKIFFAKKNFHIGDFNLYYMNIRENVKNRINSYERKKSL